MSETPAIPWYRSPVYIGAVVTILSTLASLAPKTFVALGLTSPDSISHTVDTVFQLITLAAGGFTAYKRSSSTMQPLTLNQASADAHAPGVQPPPVPPPSPKP